MSTSTRPDPPDTSLLALAGLGPVVAGVASVWSSAALAARTRGPDVATNPFEYVLGLISGQSQWPGETATMVLVGQLVVVGLLAGALVAWRVRAAARRSRVDPKAGNLARPRDLAHLGPSAVAASVARLRPAGAGPDPAEQGVFIGHAVPSGMMLRSTWEDTLLLVAGPRTAKTSCYTVPAVCDAPGAVVATSNKRDLHDATREVRAERGTVWNFDPQQVVGQAPTWWFDPLAQVRSITDAKNLASHFVTGTRSANAKTDAYFDTEGERLLSAVLLAAARTPDASLLDAYKWLCNPYNPAPVEALTAAGDEAVAERVKKIMQDPEKQRDGVYGAALSLTGCLEDPAVIAWVTPPRDNRPRFDPAAFVASTDTLYSHSREGEGSAGPLVAALTQAVFDAGMAAATHLPAGRLDPPLLSVLDEAANVVRLRHLADNYSHYGSRGLPLLTVLQSWEQGVEVWGKSGMKKLWDTANIRIYGGGVADPDYTDMLSRLIGEHERTTVSRTVDHRGQRSRSVQTRPTRIYDAAALASLPRGRAVVLASGAPPVLVALTPWWQGQHAAAIRASIAAHDPTAREPGTTVTAPASKGA